MLQPTAGGQPMGDTGRTDVQRREDFREVVRRRLAFDIGTEGENDFRGILFADSFKEGLDSQLGRANVVERRETSAKCVVKALKNPATLQRKDISGLLDDADFFPLSRWLQADFAKFRDSEEAAFFARMDR